MIFGLLLIMLALASDKQQDESIAKSGETLEAKSAENLILVKIEEEEEEYTKTIKKTSKYVGVTYKKITSKWSAARWNKNEQKMVYNGCYKDEETAALASDNLARKLAASGKQNLKLNFTDSSTEVYPEENTTSSNYIGVSYSTKSKAWIAKRYNRYEKKDIENGYYKDEKAAAHASDTLARKLMTNGGGKLILNFPDDNTEVNKKTTTPNYIGVRYKDKTKKWIAQRWSKSEQKMVYNGHYNDAETAAHASDTLAGKLMENGEQNHKLNFPDDRTEVNVEKHPQTSNYIGVSYIEKSKKWYAQRWSKNEKRIFTNGYYKNEETAAHASDTLARKLMANGEQNLKFNYTDDNKDVYPEKKTTSSQYIGVCYKYKTWAAVRWSKNEYKRVYNGHYKEEETAAHASDTLARKLMANGEQNHKFNFPKDSTEENQRNKRKRSHNEDLVQNK